MTEVHDAGLGNLTSVYLTHETKEKLIALADASGKSRSQVIRDLITQAGSEDRIRMLQLMEEMSDLMTATT